MNILLLLGEIAYISRNNAIRGIVDEAKKEGNNVFLFTCEGFVFHSLEDYSAGEYEIFKLPYFESYDGVIVDFNSIHDDKTIEYIKDKLNKTGKPCVSFGYELEGAVTIKCDYRDVFTKMIEHMIKDHGFTNIHMLTGPKVDSESILRVEIFENTMKAHNLCVSEDAISYSNFNIDGGKKKAYEYVANKNLPEAVICANDFMAVGLIEGLSENGIRCPEDIAITGFDNAAIGQMMEPVITTIDSNDYEVGVSAYRAVSSLIAGENCEKTITVSAKMIVGGSCGCKDNNSQRAEVGSVVHSLSQIDQSLDLIKAFNITCGEANTIREFEQAVTPLISHIGSEYFYYCQCGTRESYYQELEMYAKKMSENDNDEVRSYSDYDNMVWCPIACEKGEWSSFSAYSLNELLPPDRNCPEAVFYIIMPVHRGRASLGYVVMGNFNWSITGRVLQHLVLGFDRVFSNIRNNDIANTMLATINKKWQYDELTSIYNRSGFYHKMQSLFDKAENEQLGLMVIFFDLDGLKKVNDEQGHKAGDEYIKSMAYQLSLLSDDDNKAVARFGGDEFIYVSLESSDEESINKSNQIRDIFDKQIPVSMGMCFGYASNQLELNSLIQNADKKMYVNKVQRKKDNRNN